MSDAVVAASAEAANPIRLVAPRRGRGRASTALPAPLRAPGQARQVSPASRRDADPGGRGRVRSWCWPGVGEAGGGDGAAGAAGAAAARALCAVREARRRRPGRPTSRWPSRSGAYRFDRYKKERGEAGARLVAPDGVDLDELRAIVARLRPGPGHDQHPGQRHGPAADGDHRPRGRRGVRRDDLGGHRRRADRGRLPGGARGRPRRDAGARAADDRDHAGARRRPAAGGAGRQGRGVRHRRARHQAGGRHAAR